MTERLRTGVSEQAKAEPKTAGEFLRMRARERGIPTKELAERIGVHPSTIRRAFRDLGYSRSYIGIRMMGIVLGYKSEYQEENVNQQIEEDRLKVSGLLSR